MDEINYHNGMTLEVLEERISNMNQGITARFDEMTIAMEHGFKRMTDRQDKTNGNVIRNVDEIAILRQWKYLTLGFCLCLSMLVIPMALYIFKQVT